MIARNLSPILKNLATLYPIVTLTGPRQSGKTTLCRHLFSALPYISLEPLDNRRYATEDPRGFLSEYRHGAVIDEAQNAPELFSYLQEAVDNNPTPGRFIITGSQQFSLLENITQSLAGRTAIAHLLPPALSELRQFPTYPATQLLSVLIAGAYPRIFDQGIPATNWLQNYVTTYVERDVRQLLHVTDLLAFTNFMKLCAGRVGQEIKLSALGADAGISHHTARAWLSVLEASYIVFRLPAWHDNTRK